MEAIENATQLKARLLDSAADPSRPGWLRVRLEIRQAGPVPDLPSLLKVGAGDTLEVLVAPADREHVEALQGGVGLDLQVRLRAPGVHTVVPGSLKAE